MRLNRNKVTQVIMKKAFLVLSCAAVVAACSNVEVATPAAANQNLANYVAVGGSLTAGFGDGKLTRDGQLAAFPNLMAQQMKTVGGGVFVQPLVAAGMELNGKEASIMSPVSGAINNFGVPGLLVFNTARSGLGDPSQSAFNPFFGRLLASGNQNKTYLEVIKDSKPTFFSIEIGNDDLMRFVQSGGKEAFTESLTFIASLEKVLAALQANGAKGIIANVPDLFAAAALNTYNFTDVQTEFKTDIFITTGSGTVRRATDKDALLNAGYALIGKPNASGKTTGLSADAPLPSEFLLDEAEISLGQRALNDYNMTVAQYAKTKNLTVVDLSALYQSVKSGKTENLKSFYAKDGFMLSPRGNALVANEFIKNTNTTLGVQIPVLDVNTFKSSN